MNVGVYGVFGADDCAGGRRCMGLAPPGFPRKCLSLKTLRCLIHALGQSL